MKFLPNTVLIAMTVAIAFIFAQQAEGNVSEALSQAAEMEKILVGKDFQDSQEAIINAGKDIESLAGREIIEAIRKSALQCIAEGIPAETVKTVLEGILAGTRLVIRSGHKALETIDAALKLKDKPEVATEALKKGFREDEQLIYLTGVPVHDAQGAALALAGGAAYPGLKKSIISIQLAGQTGFGARKISEEIASLGLRAGGVAADIGCKAAKEVVHTAGLVVLDYITEATKDAFDGLRNATAASRSILQTDLVPGIINSLRTGVTTNNPEALKAIQRIDNGLKVVLGQLTKKPAIDGAKIMSEGIKSTIIETADALSVAKEAFRKAATLADDDTEAAVAATREGIKVAIDEVISGSAGGYLGLGAAGQIGGKKSLDRLIPAVLEIEFGRVAAYEDLKLAEQTMITALRAKGLAAVQGVLAGIEICDAAGSTLFTSFVDGAENGFDALRSI